MIVMFILEPLLLETITNRTTNHALNSMKMPLDSENGLLTTTKYISKMSEKLEMV